MLPSHSCGILGYSRHYIICWGRKYSHYGDSLQVAHFQWQVLTDNKDSPYHRHIRNASHFPFLSAIFSRNPLLISAVYGSVQGDTWNSILYSLVFVLFKCVCWLLNYLLITIDLFFCVLLFPVVATFGGWQLSSMTRYRRLHVFRHPVPLWSIESNIWIRGDKVAYMLSNVWAKDAHVDITVAVFVSFEFILCILIFLSQPPLLLCRASADTHVAIRFTISIRWCFCLCIWLSGLPSN
jgi:hypothetical protein